jgi:hypothetical protein
MTKEISGIPADKFHWRRNYGWTSVEELGFMPREFFSFSPVTNRVKHFVINTEDPGYEDHWDGEMVKFIDTEKKFFITITYEKPWL